MDETCNGKVSMSTKIQVSISIKILASTGFAGQ